MAATIGIESDFPFVKIVSSYISDDDRTLVDSSF